ncbi:MAG: hypothetical protein J1F35_07190 [Erysipelotrichales bacterium]|nr:hypothetical protein [Erysipelotrichales bacterium]
MDFLTEEQQQNVQEVIISIKAFEEGNLDFYDDMILIIEQIKNYKNKMRFYTTFYKLLLNYSRFKYKLQGLVNNDLEELYSSCISDLSFFKECEKIIGKYLSIGEKSGNYPDLEAAYLLTIHLSGLLHCFNDYLDEINTLAKNQVLEFGYTGDSKALKRREERMTTIATLANAIKVQE